jgi:signal transduction histidine kinase
MGLSELQHLTTYLGFDADDLNALRGFYSFAEAELDEIVDDFYAAILRDAQTRAVLRGGHPQLDRLRKSLRRWLEVVLLNERDEAWLAIHDRISRQHVEVDLPVHTLVGAMARIRARFSSLCLRAPLSQAARERTLLAIGRALDVELSVLIEGQLHAMGERSRDRDRLAFVGEISAALAHDLRNPLSTIETSLFLARKRVPETADPSLARHLERTSAQVEACNGIITGILELTRARPLTRRPVDVDAVAREAVETANVPSDVELILDVPAGLLTQGERWLLRQLLHNLLANAGRAAHKASPNGRVRLEARRVDRGIVISVEDNGEGVPSELRGRLFDPLFTTRPDGHGLGLALCRRIAEAHGGRITYEPREPGSAFRVEIPDPVPVP